MSQENVEIVRRMHESMGGSEVRFPDGFLHPDVEWVNPPYAAEPGTRCGKAAFEQAAARVSGAFDEFRFEDDKVIDAGDDRVLVATFVVHGRGSGVNTASPRATSGRFGTAGLFASSGSTATPRLSKPWDCGSSDVAGEHGGRAAASSRPWRRHRAARR
jgi:ketosteroid isomerase-like protein